jgi:hypothetical protein
LKDFRRNFPISQPPVHSWSKFRPSYTVPMTACTLWYLLPMIWSIHLLFWQNVGGYSNNYPKLSEMFMHNIPPK